MNCLHIKTDRRKDGTVFAVLRREYTPKGIIYHLCDKFGRFIGVLHEDYCEVLET